MRTERISMGDDRRDGRSRARAELEGRRVLVAGLGVTGAAVSRFLVRFGARVTVADDAGRDKLSSAAELSDMGVEVCAGGSYALPSEDAPSMVVVSPGVPHYSPLLGNARARGAEVISEVELAYRYIDSPVIAVAGTNGKSTVTALLGRVFKEAGVKAFVGGNIGRPAIECLEGEDRPECCVLEVSSFHLETTDTFAPYIAVLLNITPDHLDRYEDFGRYAATKMRLFEFQDPDDWAVVNSADPAVGERIKDGVGHARLLRFSAAAGAHADVFIRDRDIVFVHPDGGGDEEIYPASPGRLSGPHNTANVMAVVAAARLFGVEPEAVRRALASFEPLAHRMERVRELDGVVYIDDSKATNTGALGAALKSVEGDVILIAGGRGKGESFEELAEPVREKVRVMILMGEAASEMRTSLGGCAETVEAASMEEAVRSARERARPGDTVLLSPACASFDMFSGYKERGLSFRAAVEAL